MSQFLLFKDITGEDLMVNTASILSISASAERPHCHSEILITGGLYEVDAPFWTIYNGLLSASPVVDLQPEVEVAS